MLYIIARYNEDISWCDDCDIKFVVQKDVHLPNKGREASSYLWFIINNYDTLEGDYEFRQGRTIDHPIHAFIEMSDHKGFPHHHPYYPALDLKRLADELNLEIPEYLTFTIGAQFKVSTEQIKRHSLEWYKKAYNIAMGDDYGPWVAHHFERLWKYIFNL